MSTLELKRQSVQNKISSLEDENMLDVINEILNSKVSEDFFILSDYEKQRSETARKQLFDGTLIPHNVVKENVEKWLKSK